MWLGRERGLVLLGDHMARRIPRVATVYDLRTMEWVTAVLTLLGLSRTRGNSSDGARRALWILRYIFNPSWFELPQLGLPTPISAFPLHAPPWNRDVEGGGRSSFPLPPPSPHPPVLAFSAVLQSSLLQGDKEEKVRSSRKRQHGVDSRAESGSQTRWERREAQRQPAEPLSPRGMARGTGVPAYGAGSRRCSVKSATLLLKLILRH